MAWAWRGNRRYYYRSTRDGGRVTKEYIGTGPVAEFCAAMDAEQHAERDATRAAWHQQRADMDAIDAQMTAWWEASTDSSKPHSMQKDITSMTEAPSANGAPFVEEIHTLLQKAEKGDKKVLPALRKLLDNCPELSKFYGSLAQTAREELLRRMAGEKNLAVQECYTRMLDAMGQELSGPEPSLLARIIHESETRP